jgi:hypothetical protein
MTTTLMTTLVAVTAGLLFAPNAFAQGASQVRSPSPLVAIDSEPPPKLIVDPPLPGPLARGAVLIPFQVEYLRILPVLGPAARNASPRIGHVHITVDNLPWRWAHFDDTNTIVVNGLPPGEHKVLVELADPEHRIFTGQTVKFTMPGPTK